MTAFRSRSETTAQASAAARTAWIIALNKPVYPVYVWYFSGSGFCAAGVTALTLPLYVWFALLSRRNARVARLGMPIIGLFDTILATKLFGAASGAELFLFPCLMLATLAPEVGEVWECRILVTLIASLALALHGHYDPALHIWEAEALDKLRKVNIFAVVSLCAFLGWTFAERLRLSSGDGSA